MIEEAIRRTDDVVFLEDRTSTSTPSQLSSLSFAPGQMGHRQLRAYIARVQDLPAIKTRFVPEQDYWLIDSSDSPVVEFSRCFFDGRVLRAGRAYFPSDLRFRPHLPEADFVKWADRVLNSIRKSLIRAPSIARYVYASRSALDWIDSNRATGNALEYRLTGSRR